MTARECQAAAARLGECSEPIAIGEGLCPAHWLVWQSRPWQRIDKGDLRARMLADKHYTRQSIGHPMWTRPGYNFCLFAETEPWWDRGVKAVWCWWRPKWEAGQERKDGLRALECTIFRRDRYRHAIDPYGWRSSALVTAAVAALGTEEARQDLAHDAPDTLALITGVGAKPTAHRRSKDHLAGHCFREAGWIEFPHTKGRADVWLRHPKRPLWTLEPVDEETVAA